MKPFAITISLLMPLFVFSQPKDKPLRLRAAYSAIIFKDSSDQYLSHSDWSEVNSIITIDGSNKRVRLFTSTARNYDISRLNFSGEDQYGYWLKFSCVDDDDKLCVIRVVVLKDETYKVYIDYANFLRVYKAVKIE